MVPFPRPRVEAPALLLYCTSFGRGAASVPFSRSTAPVPLRARLISSEGRRPFDFCWGLFVFLRAPSHSRNSPARRATFCGTPMALPGGGEQCRAAGDGGAKSAGNGAVPIAELVAEDGSMNGALARSVARTGRRSRRRRTSGERPAEQGGVEGETPRQAALAEREAPEKAQCAGSGGGAPLLVLAQRQLDFEDVGQEGHVCQGKANALDRDAEDVVYIGALVDGVVLDGAYTWHALRVPRAELDLHLTLLTGQTFRWRQTGEDEYTGVVGTHLVCLRRANEELLFARLIASAHDAHEAPLDDCGGSSGPSFRVRKRARKTGIVAETVPACVEDLDAGLVLDTAEHGRLPQANSPGPAHRPPLHLIREKGQSRSTAESGAEDSADLPRWLLELCDFLNLRVSTGDLFTQFAASDARFQRLHVHVSGYRILRQDPVECLFQFVCSSNNNIARITGMVQQLARLGPRLGEAGDHEFHAFPDLSTIQALSEEELRAMGFGYRAKFVVDTAKLLAAQGGQEWLLGLRGPRVSWEEAEAALSGLPGVGPKVAACVALFSLDQHSAIPVDTHVWRLAVTHYCVQFRTKTITARARQQIVAALTERFGVYAGWAVNAMFIAELPAIKKKLEQQLAEKQMEPGP